jgi:hypothetical protein
MDSVVMDSRMIILFKSKLLHWTRSKFIDYDFAWNEKMPYLFILFTILKIYIPYNLILSLIGIFFLKKKNHDLDHTPYWGQIRDL